MEAWKRKNLHSHRIFASLLVPNVLLMLLALFAGWFVYQQTLKLVEEEIITANMKAVQQSRDMIDRRLSEIALIAFRLANDPGFVKFQDVRGSFSELHVYDIFKTRKSIENFSSTNNFIFNYFIAYKHNDVIFEETTVYQAGDFYKRFQYVGMDRSTWDKLLFTSYLNEVTLPAREVEVNGVLYSLVSYIKSIGYPGFPLGAVVVTIDNREMQKLLGGSDLSDGGWIYMTNKAGEVISSLSSDALLYQMDDQHLLRGEGSVVRRMNGRDMLAVYTTSTFNDWTYVVMQPMDAVLGKLLYIKKTTLTLSSVFLVIGFAFAYWFAFRNSRPLRQILQTLLERTDLWNHARTDTYRLLKDSITRLIDDQSELRDKVEQQAPLLQAALLERLIRGEYVSVHDASVLLNHLGIERHDKLFAVGILQWNRNDNLDSGMLEQPDIVRVKVKDILHKELSDTHWHDFTENQIVVLFSLEMEMNDLEERIDNVREVIRDVLEVTVNIALGNIYEGHLNISRSFEEARMALDFLIWSNSSGLIIYSRLPMEAGGYYYPADIERRLENLAKAGDHENVSVLLQELYRINFKGKHPLTPMLRLFLYEIWASLYRLLPQVGADHWNIVPHLASLTGDSVSYEGLDKNYEVLTKCYLQICDLVNSRRKSQNVLLLEKIRRIVHESFTQADCSLDTVAERIQISTGYLSQFHKEQMGIGFAEYLENLRMEQAQQFLTTTELPVHEIARQVGYNSSNTFCRAFKRIHGVSATMYRR